MPVEDGEAPQYITGTCIHGYTAGICARCRPCASHGRILCSSCGAHRSDYRVRHSDLRGNTTAGGDRGDSGVPAPRCPGAGCDEWLAFGRFQEHSDHAESSELFRRRELARLARLHIARQRGPRYPAYSVFPNSGLDRFATVWPQSGADFRQYFGEGKHDSWGRELLEVIATYGSDLQAAGTRSPSDSSPDAQHVLDASLDLLDPGRARVHPDPAGEARSDEDVEAPEQASASHVDEIGAAATVIRVLLRGIDPYTGEVFDTAHSLRQPGVVRALEMALG